MPEDLLTVGDICRALNVPSHILNHALQRHGPAPTARIGIARVWPRSALPAIEASINKTATPKLWRSKR